MACSAPGRRSCPAKNLALRRKFGWRGGKAREQGQMMNICQGSEVGRGCSAVGVDLQGRGGKRRGGRRRGGRRRKGDEEEEGDGNGNGEEEGTGKGKG